ncbi:hypothetical protein [Halobacillus salinus]|nr:hypothetical protein [Halobacillus salinus]
MKSNSYLEHLVQEFTENLGRELTEEEMGFLLWLAHLHMENEDE